MSPLDTPPVYQTTLIIINNILILPLVTVGEEVRALLPVGRGDLAAVDEEADEAAPQETEAADLDAVSEGSSQSQRCFSTLYKLFTVLGQLL